ncbi:hypothetical protein SAMN05660860_00884 [Geoalkalibacter ferrihydriticus]|uniref:Uncharacterized protein n=2 Tax=Geoalkalibacter ferrihydriticus TaxID=392333 RepID=A0A0C2HIC0_9BACT|nr:hypothetical protein [Geoalkalibacter ferrihydriticus]KIH76741.1 hypothetical protein GFER_06280 [Geoalkalibacter ferrihydriticus DSM 17813]SDL54213.1 hypothetical protein SAMN05660860_00884 [Geoalkalibacter ferrihydriticus]
MNTIIEFLKRRKIFTVFAAIVLGAIGSGTWEYIFKPIILLSRDFILNVTTLGIEKFKNEVYLDISRGYTENTSLNILGEINQLYFTFSIIFCLWAYTKIKDIKKDKKEILGNLVELEKELDGNFEQKCQREHIKELREILSNLNTKSTTILLYIFILIVVISTSARYMNFAKTSYINSAISHYKQGMQIIKPYIPTERYILIESEFAQINRKEDYVNVLNKIYIELERNNFNYRKFDAW